MAIDISVKYNGGLLPDIIILLTQGYYYMEMSKLTRDGTAEPVSRDQILRHARGQGNIFPVQLTTSRIGNLTRLIHTLLYVMTIHTYIHTIGEPVYVPCSGFLSL